MPSPARPTRTIASNTVESFALKVLLYGTAFAASALISRALGPEGRGVYYLPVVTAATVAVVATLGLEQSNVYMYGQRAISLDRLWSQSGLVALLLGTMGAIVLVLLPLGFPRMFGISPFLLWCLVAAGLPLTLHAQFAAGLLTLRGDVTWQFRVGLASGVIQTIALIGLFLTARLEPHTVLAVTLVTTALTWLLTVTRIRAAGGWIGWEAALLRESLKQSLVLHAATVLLFLHLRADMFMLSHMLGPRQLGIYSLSVTLAETVLLATDSVAVSVLPRAMENTIRDASRMALRAARVNLLLSLCLALGWAAVGLPVIVLAFGGEFEESYLPLLGLLPGMSFLGMQRVCGGPVLRTGRPARLVWFTAASLACNVLLNLALIPAWGPAGAAVASTCSYALGAAFMLRWTAALGDLPFPAAIVPARQDIADVWGGLARLIGQRPAVRA
jgi:O-antigen/teichoic acid export membrane protein